MSHVGLLLYVLLPDSPDSSLIYDALLCLSYYASLVLENHTLRMTTRQGNGMARLPWLQEIGIERIVSRLASTLAETQKHMQVEGTLVACLHVIWYLACCRGTVKHVFYHRLFGRVNRAVSLYAHHTSQGPELLRVWCAEQDIFRYAYRAALPRR